MSETMIMAAAAAAATAADETCSIHEDGRTICYINNPINDVITNATEAVASDGGRFSTFLHDAKLVIGTVFLTCIVMFAYNFYLDYVCNSASSKTKEEDDDDDKEDPFASDMKNRQKSKKLINMSTSAKSSIAASLAEIEGMQASGNFLSAIFDQMWEHLNIAVSNTIKETLEPTLKDLPVPLHFIRLDLGDVPIKTKNMFIHRVDLSGDRKGMKETQAGIQIDVDVIWDGNCDIMLQATMTKGVKVTFGVEKIKLSGRMHILLSPMTNELPVISAVQYGFTNPPELQLSFTGAAGLLTNNVGFVQSSLVNVIQQSLAGMLVLPYRMVMPMDLGTYDYFDTYQPPVGMLRLTAVKGRGFKLLKKMILNDIPDLYCMVTLGASNTFRPPFRTKTIYNNLNPSWEDENCDFILYDMDQKVYVDVYDEDKGPMDPDDLMGKAEITVRDLFRNDGTCELELYMDKKKTGCYVTIRAELFYLTDQLQSMKSLMYEGKNDVCALATIIVTKAFDVPIPKEDAATYIKVVYGEGCKHEKEFYTGTVSDYPGIDALNPMFDCVFHVPITSEMLSCLPPLEASKKSLTGDLRASLKVVKRLSISSKRVVPKDEANNIVFTLIDTDGANGSCPHGELGKLVITHEELRRAFKHTITGTRQIGDNGAKLEFRVSLKGLQSEDEKASLLKNGAPQSLSEKPVYRSLYSGLENGMTIRVTALRGRGFPIRKRRLGKKDDVPDVYCIIRLNSDKSEDDHELSSTCWKTKTIKDDTMPQWGESRDFENIDPQRDILRVDVYDENKGGRDDYLGSAEFHLEKMIRKRFLEVELMNNINSSSSSKSGSKTMSKMFMTLMCIQMESTPEEMKGGEVLVHCHPDMGDEGFESTLVANDRNGTARIEEDADEDGEDDDVIAPLVSISDHLSLVADRNSPSNDDDTLSMTSASSSSSVSRKMRKSFGKISKKFSGKKSKSK